MRNQCSTCKAPLRYGLTSKGREIPIDPEPHPDGNILLTTEGRAIVVKNRSILKPGTLLYRSHFVTCPQAAQHRRKRRS